MQEEWIQNQADDLPFAGILADLLASNLSQRPEKRAIFDTMRGTVAIELSDIEAAVTLFFEQGRLRLGEGVSAGAQIVIRTTSDCVMDLNALRIVCGLPWYFDEAGRKVLGHLFTGRLRISGLLPHPVLLTKLTKIMSVM